MKLNIQLQSLDQIWERMQQAIGGGGDDRMKQIQEEEQRRRMAFNLDRIINEGVLIKNPGNVVV